MTPRPKVTRLHPGTGPLASAGELAAIVDQVPSIIALFDMDLRNRFTNWTHVPWLGLHPNDLLGCSPADIVGTSVFAEAKPYYDAVREGVPQTFERIMTLATGERRHVAVNYEPYIVDGAVRGVVTLATDVTGRVRAEFARHELAARAAAIGERERAAFAKQRSATDRLQRMATDLAAVAQRHPDYAASIEDASETMSGAAQRLQALVAHRPGRGQGRPPGPERTIREVVDAAASALGFRPALLVLGVLDTLPQDITELVAQVLRATLDNIARHARAERVDVTVGIEHDDVVVVVADDGGGVVRAQPHTSLGQLRTAAAARGGRCTWIINADDGTTVEWRVPLYGPAMDAGPLPTGLVARPAPAGAATGYRDPSDLALDEGELRLLLDHLPMALAVWDAEIRNQYANRTAAAWFGLPDPAALLGRPYREFVNQATLDRVVPLAEAALAGTEVVMERPFDSGPGYPRHIRNVLTPRVVGGEIVGVNVQVTDIGERVRAESALQAERQRVESMRERHAAEEEVHHLAIQEVFAAALRLDAVRPTDRGAATELDDALAPLDDAIADLRMSVVA